MPYNLLYKPSLLLFSLSLMATGTANAANSSDTIEAAGDVLMVAIPALAYGSTYYMDDDIGRNQFYTSFITNAVATYGLKKGIDKERPDGSDHDSFPSGHTSLAFQGASFIHKRYGFEYSVPAYIGATLVGYSRVEADKHHTSDVLAGAALGIASSMLLTTKYNEHLNLTTQLSPESYQVAIQYRF